MYEVYAPDQGDNKRDTPITRWLDAAADAYTTVLCEFLISIFTKGDFVYDPSDLVGRWRVCNIEAACVFDPQHFDTNSVCDCQESNEAPEVRNLSHAIRCRSTRRVAAADEIYFETHGQAAPQQSAHSRREALNRDYLETHPPTQTAHGLDGIPVLPFGPDVLYDAGCTPGELFAHIDDAVQSYGSEDDWNALHDSQDNSTTSGLAQRTEILSIVAVLLTEDNGLPRRQIEKVFGNFMNLLRPADAFFKRAPVNKSYGHAMLTLLQLKTFSAGRHRQQNPLLNPTRFLNLTLTLRQKRMLRFRDEKVFEDAIMRTLEPVLKAELDAYKNPRCLLCKDKLITCDRSLSEQQELESSDDYERSHLAIRVLCKSKHIFCTKCWMGYWKAQRASGQPDVRCHECDDKLPLWQPNPTPALQEGEIFDPFHASASDEPRMNWPSLVPAQRHPQDWGVWDPLLGANFEPRATYPQSPSHLKGSNGTLDRPSITTGAPRLRLMDDMHLVGLGTWMNDREFSSITEPGQINDHPFAQQRAGGTAGRAGWTAATKAMRQVARANPGLQVRKGLRFVGQTREQSRAAYLERKKNRLVGRSGFRGGRV
ncbi:hypothetical protein ACHAQH_004191 [Verticillium albo-atrum]